METTHTPRLIEKESVDLTTNILYASEDNGLILLPFKGHHGRALRLIEIEAGEVGYERKSDWMRLVNKLNNHNTTPIRRMICGDKKNANWDGCNVEIDGSDIAITFNVPVEAVVGETETHYVTTPISKVTGEISWDWYYSRQHFLDLGNISNALDVFVDNIVYHS